MQLQEPTLLLMAAMEVHGNVKQVGAPNTVRQQDDCCASDSGGADFN